MFLHLREQTLDPLCIVPVDQMVQTALNETLKKLEKSQFECIYKLFKSHAELCSLEPADVFRYHSRFPVP